MQKIHIAGDININLFFDCHQSKFGDEYVILHKVQIGVWHMVDFPLPEKHDKTYFEDKLTANTGLLCFDTAEQAELFYHRQAI